MVGERLLRTATRYVGGLGCVEGENAECRVPPSESGKAIELQSHDKPGDAEDAEARAWII